MWQFGILAVDLLTNLRLSGSHTTGRRGTTLFHHDVWPLLQKIALHAEYFEYLLEDTFVAVPFGDEDLDLSHDFVTRILRIEPESRMSAEEARGHAFVDVGWPQLPKEFTLPERVEEHLFEPLPLPKEELGDPSLTVDQVMAAEEEKQKEALPDAPSKGALDVMKRKKKQMQKEKLQRRETILVEAGKKLLEIKPAPSGQLKKPTAGSKKATEAKSSDEETMEEADQVKVTHPVLKMPSGKEQPIKVTAIKRTSVGRKSKDASKPKANN